MAERGHRCPQFWANNGWSDVARKSGDQNQIGRYVPTADGDRSQAGAEYDFPGIRHRGLLRPDVWIPQRRNHVQQQQSCQFLADETGR